MKYNRCLWLPPLTGGFSLAARLLDGDFADSQAEDVQAPYGEINLLTFPDNVPNKIDFLQEIRLNQVELYLSDILSISYYCVHDAGVYKGNTVLSGA